MTRLTRISLLLAVFFGLDKIVAILRQVVIARQFGLSKELDAFNVANNLPDLLFALISGGALAMAFIPVLTEVLTINGRKSAWDLFSRIANLAFVVTAIIAVLIALFADPLVRWELGIAPGFVPEQQALVITLMRLNLIATLVFSISGLVMAGLQANQHFLLPAMAPLLYNIGQIFGALVLAPNQGYVIGGFHLPAYGLGVYGLVYGVILGAVLHLCIQIPGLIAYKFVWIPGFGFIHEDVKRVISLLGPRLITILFVQLTFIVRDNLASRLQEGAVSALTYGWMIQQLPETLIGTAIGTALLPTLAEQFARQDREAYQQTMKKIVNVLIAVTLPVAAILSFGLRPLMAFAFGFNPQGTDLLLWATRGYLLGLTGHCLLEVAARSYYAQQDGLTPLFGSILNVLIYIIVGSQLYRLFGAPGISFTDAIAFTTQAVFLLIILRSYPKLRSKFESGFPKTILKLKGLSILLGRITGKATEQTGRLVVTFHPTRTILRGVLAAIIAGGLTALIIAIGPSGKFEIFSSLGGMAIGVLCSVPFIWPEIRVLMRL